MCVTNISQESERQGQGQRQRERETTEMVKKEDRRETGRDGESEGGRERGSRETDSAGVASEREGVKD